MHTGTQFVDFAPNQLVETEDLKDRFFDYLNEQALDLCARVYDEPGVFGSIGLGIDLSVAGELSITGDAYATDGLGHLLDPSQAAAYCQDVPYEDAIGVTYEVSLHHADGPWISDSESTVRANADTGAPEYIARMNFIGEAGEPDDVQIVGDDIVFTIDSLCEVGVSHAGRSALVYLLTPQSISDAIALPILTVAYSGGLNKITVLTDKLGQTTVSTNPAHYRVIVLGPTIRRNSSNVGVSGYVVLGSIVDNDVDTSEQHPLNVSLSNVNEALNSFAQNLPIEQAKSGPKDAMPAALWGAASVEYDGSLLSIGGIISFPAENVSTNAIYAYDPGTDSWAAKAAVVLDTYTAHLAACRVGDIVYVAGGHNGTTATNKLRRYDALNDVFLSDGATMPSARHGGALVQLGDFLYYVAGDTAVYPASSPQISVFRYSLNTNQWASVADLPAAKSRVNAASDGSKLYVLGGINDAIGNISVSSYSYDPTTNAWTALANEPRTAKYPFGSIDEGPFAKPAICVIGKSIHLVAGLGSESGVFSFHHAYSVTNDEWTVMPRPEIPHVHGTSFALIDGSLYMFGGVVRNGMSYAVTDRGYAVNLSSVRAATRDGAAIDTGEVLQNGASATINTLDALSEARAGLSICQLGTGYLITGGCDSISGTYTASAEMYWPQTRVSCLVADMPDPRAWHGSVQYGETAIILSGRIEQTLHDSRVWAFYYQTNNWSELLGVGEGPLRSRYALAVDGATAYLVGGYDDSAVPVELDTVEVFDLASLRTRGVGSIAASPIGDSAAAVLGGVLYEVSDNLVRASPINRLNDTNVDSALYGVQNYTLPSSISYGAMAAWDGSLYIYDPANGRIIRYYPRDYSHEIVATGLPNLYRTGMVIRNGRAYLFGGSTVVGLTTASSAVREIILPNVPTLESSRSPSNFTNGKQAESIGFKAGQIYGALCWDAATTASYTRMSLEID